MRRTVWWRWLVIGAINVASSVGCQLIAGLNEPLGSGSADADAGELTCTPAKSCGDPSAGCCITHDGSAFTNACVTTGCTQPDMNLYFCYSPDDCPAGQVCCAHTLFSPPKAPNTIYSTVCSPGRCPADYSTLLCDDFHQTVCGDAECLPQDTPPAGFPSYSYCNN